MMDCSVSSAPDFRQDHAFCLVNRFKLVGLINKTLTGTIRKNASILYAAYRPRSFS
jgi:hypothetical protein